MLIQLGSLQFGITGRSVALTLGRMDSGSLRHVAFGVTFRRRANILFTLTDVPGGVYTMYNWVRRDDGRWNYTRHDSRGSLLSNPPVRT